MKVIIIVHPLSLKYLLNVTYQLRDGSDVSFSIEWDGDIC